MRPGRKGESVSYFGPPKNVVSGKRVITIKQAKAIDVDLRAKLVVRGNQITIVVELAPDLVHATWIKRVGPADIGGVIQLAGLKATRNTDQSVRVGIGLINIRKVVAHHQLIRSGQDVIQSAGNLVVRTSERKHAVVGFKERARA